MVKKYSKKNIKKRGNKKSQRGGGKATAASRAQLARSSIKGRTVAPSLPKKQVGQSQKTSLQQQATLAKGAIASASTCQTTLGKLTGKPTVMKSLSGFLDKTAAGVEAKSWHKKWKQINAALGINEPYDDIDLGPVKFFSRVNPEAAGVAKLIDTPSKRAQNYYITHSLTSTIRNVYENNASDAGPQCVKSLELQWKNLYPTAPIPPLDKPNDIERHTFNPSEPFFLSQLRATQCIPIFKSRQTLYNRTTDPVPFQDYQKHIGKLQTLSGLTAVPLNPRQHCWLCRNVTGFNPLNDRFDKNKQEIIRQVDCEHILPIMAMGILFGYVYRTNMNELGYAHNSVDPLTQQPLMDPNRHWILNYWTSCHSCNDLKSNALFYLKEPTGVKVNLPKIFIYTLDIIFDKKELNLSDEAIFIICSTFRKDDIAAPPIMASLGITAYDMVDDNLITLIKALDFENPDGDFLKQIWELFFKPNLEETTTDFVNSGLAKYTSAGNEIADTNIFNRIETVFYHTILIAKKLDEMLELKHTDLTNFYKDPAGSAYLPVDSTTGQYHPLDYTIKEILEDPNKIKVCEYFFDNFSLNRVNSTIPFPAQLEKTLDLIRPLIESERAANACDGLGLLMHTLDAQGQLRGGGNTKPKTDQKTGGLNLSFLSEEELQVAIEAANNLTEAAGAEAAGAAKEKAKEIKLESKDPKKEEERIKTETNRKENAIKLMQELTKKKQETATEESAPPATAAPGEESAPQGEEPPAAPTANSGTPPAPEPAEDPTAAPAAAPPPEDPTVAPATTGSAAAPSTAPAQASAAAPPGEELAAPAAPAEGAEPADPAPAAQTPVVETAPAVAPTAPAAAPAAAQTQVAQESVENSAPAEAQTGASIGGGRTRRKRNRKANKKKIRTNKKSRSRNRRR